MSFFMKVALWIPNDPLHYGFFFLPGRNGGINGEKDSLFKIVHVTVGGKNDMELRDAEQMYAGNYVDGKCLLPLFFLPPLLQ